MGFDNREVQIAVIAAKYGQFPLSVRQLYHSQRTVADKRWDPAGILIKAGTEHNEFLILTAQKKTSLLQVKTKSRDSCFLGTLVQEDSGLEYYLLSIFRSSEN
ncbi:hypothetical protein J6590_074366 [Homalodisca vitripennis]|nr:hypothetical protein J6590_074366 [Homalodisca vitripennis]